MCHCKKRERRTLKINKQTLHLELNPSSTVTHHSNMMITPHLHQQGWRCVPLTAGTCDVITMINKRLKILLKRTPKRPLTFEREFFYETFMHLGEINSISIYLQVFRSYKSSSWSCVYLCFHCGEELVALQGKCTSLYFRILFITIAVVSSSNGSLMIHVLKPLSIYQNKSLIIKN